LFIQFALVIEVEILFIGFSPRKRLQRKARPASWRETPKLLLKITRISA